MLQRRRLAGLLVGLALVAAVVAQEAKPNPAATPVPRDQKWMVRHNLLTSRAKAGGIDVMWIGDSITHGWEGGGKKVWDKDLAPLKSGNFGIGGDRTQHVLWRLQNGNLDDNLKPKVCVIMIGTNNVGSDKAEDTAGGVQAIVKYLRDKRPDAQILLLAIFPRGEKATDKARVKNDQVNALLAKFDDGQKVHFLDIGKQFLKEDGTLGRDIMPDLLHPNAKGYQIWSDAVVPTIKKLLG